MSVSVFPKGTSVIRCALASALSKGPMDAADIAARLWGQGSQPARFLKAAIGSAGTVDSSWGAELSSEYAVAGAEFQQLVRNQSIIGSLSGLRRIPPRTPMLTQQSGATGAWTPEGRAMPIGKAAYVRQSLELLKITATTIITKELLEQPVEAEAVLRADLVAALAEASDQAFIDPANAGVPGEMPASITNGLPLLNSSSDPDDILACLIANFSGDLGRSFLIGRPECFVLMSGFEYPNLGARGGEMGGIPCIGSKSVPNTAGGKYQLILCDPGGIAYASDPAGLMVKSTTQGTIEMLDSSLEGDSLTPTPASSGLVSMWQVGAVAIAAKMSENWRVDAPGAVAIIDTGIAVIEPVLS